MWNRLISTIMLFIFPQKLKYRFFFSFIIFILLPFVILQINNHGKLEQVIAKQIRLKSMEQIQLIESLLENTRSQMFRQLLSIEQQPELRSWLQESTATSERIYEKKEFVEQILAYFKLRISSYSEHISYEIEDIYGNQYMSSEVLALESTALVSLPVFVEMTSNNDPYQWVQTEPAYITLYGLLQTSTGEMYGYLRMKFNYNQWLNDLSRDFLIQENYYLVNEQGITMGASNGSLQLDEQLAREIMESGSLHESLYRSDKSLYNYNYMPELGWYLISHFPLDLYFGDLDDLQSESLTTILLLTLLFVVITFVISSRMTKPLRLLQRGMAEVTRKNFRTRIPENRHFGEFLSLAHSFNSMVEDINRLIEQLKAEERQKEAVHFNMLQSQMNPHFLMNTLNTIKWNVLEKGDVETAEICVSLGKLLETSLNTDVDLIYLSNEKALLNAFMNIQNFRYDGMLELIYEIEVGLEHALVPKLSLQTLVENSIKHGLDPSKGRICIVVRISKIGDQIMMEVDDDGIGLHSKPSKIIGRRGIGLENLRERIRLLFKGQGSFKLISLDKGTRAQLKFPLLISNPYEEGKDIRV